MIQDPQGRTIDYLRLAVTDRCNLRCQYCLPEGYKGFMPKREILSYEELTRLLTILSNEGVSKLRITGGEPFVRRDLIHWIEELSGLDLFDRMHITTNGVLTLPYVEALERMGFEGVNLSVDSFNRETFKRITGRDELPKVMETLDALTQTRMKVRVNTVVLTEHNLDELHELVDYGTAKAVDVRFIEEMPFNGTGEVKQDVWDYRKILHHLSKAFDLIPTISEPNGTALWYRIPGRVGRVGVIPAYSRTFCGTCNRLRIDPKGKVKTCLYGKDEVDLGALMRAGAEDEALSEALIQAISRRHPNGVSAEREMLQDSIAHKTMASIGG